MRQRTSFSFEFSVSFNFRQNLLMLISVVIAYLVCDIRVVIKVDFVYLNTFSGTYWIFYQA